MPTLAESLESPVPTQIHDALAVGVDVLSGQQVVSFAPYVRTVLPIDGYVFWLNAKLLSPKQLADAGLPSADPVEVQGSLHYASAGYQVDDETIAIRKVDFTAETQITAFAEIAPKILYVGSWTAPLGTFKFTFSSRGTYYVQADVHHYVGDAIYPAFEAQLIDDVDQFDQRQVVSNSLPLWMAMLSSPPFPSLITLSLDLYPSFLVPDNLAPPYGVIDVSPSGTRALQSAPLFDRTESRAQLCADRVRVVLYGLNNDLAMDFIDYVSQYSELSGLFGLMNAPVLRDEKRTQVELAALAMKKTIEFEVDYYQTRVRDIARKLIETAVPTFYLSDKPLESEVPLIIQMVP